eukprot:m.85137 g.85137  ORF g.85137 m.85137 type:complete len:1345 (-) comp8730_c0_seq1:868-4902(-)
MRLKLVVLVFLFTILFDSVFGFKDEEGDGIKHHSLHNKNHPSNLSTNAYLQAPSKLQELCDKASSQLLLNDNTLQTTNFMLDFQNSFCRNNSISDDNLGSNHNVDQVNNFNDISGDDDGVVKIHTIQDGFLLTEQLSKEIADVDILYNRIKDDESMSPFSVGSEIEDGKDSTKSPIIDQSFPWSDGDVRSLCSNLVKKHLNALRRRQQEYTSLRDRRDQPAVSSPFDDVYNSLICEPLMGDSKDENLRDVFITLSNKLQSGLTKCEGDEQMLKVHVYVSNFDDNLAMTLSKFINSCNQHIMSLELMAETEKDFERVLRLEVWKSLIKLTKLELEGLSLHLSTDVFDTFPKSVTELKIFNVPQLTLNQGDAVFQHLESLTRLVVQRCTFTNGIIQSTHLSNLTKLMILDISFNDLQSYLPLPHLPSLQFFRSTANKLQRVNENDFINVSQLLILDLSANAISFIDERAFSSVPKLFVLRLYGNLLSNAFLDGGVMSRLHHLVYVWLGGNTEIRALKEGHFRNMRQLEGIYIQNANVASIDEQTFRNLTKLKYLRLHGNQLQTLPPRLFKTNTMLEIASFHSNEKLSMSVEVFLNIATLDSIDLSHINELSLDRCGMHLNGNCSQTFGQVNHFFFHGAKVTKGTLSDFLSHFKNLSSLSFGWSGLTNEDLKMNKVCGAFNPDGKGSYLSIRGTSITNISNCDNKTISRLYLQSNKKLNSVKFHDLQELSVEDCHRLKTLDIATVEFVDISGTNIAVSSRLCNTIGEKIMFARKMQHSSFKLIGHLFIRNCIGKVDVLDISENAWVDVGIARLGLRSSYTFLGNLEEQPAILAHIDTNELIKHRSSIPQLIMSSTVVDCSVEFESFTYYELCSARSITRSITFKFTCRCITGYFEKGDTCVKKGWTESQIAGMVVGTSFLILICVGFIARKKLKRQFFIQQELVSNIGLKEKLLSKQGEEVAALKSAWEINFSDLSSFKLVDEGSFSKVFRAYWDGVEVAVKVMKHHRVVETDSLANFDKELDFLRRTRHTNLVRFFGTGVRENKAGEYIPFLVLEYVGFGSLYTILHKKGGLGYLLKQMKNGTSKCSHAFPSASNYLEESEDDEDSCDFEDVDNVMAELQMLNRKETKKERGIEYSMTTDELRVCLLADVANGMAFLHRQKLLNRDLKTGNILVSDKFIAKLSDFGSIKKRFQATAIASNTTLYQESNLDISDGQELLKSNTSFLSASMTMGVGTPLYMAPEILLGAVNFTDKCDVFSFGVVMWEMLNERVPDLVKETFGKKEVKGNYLLALKRLLSQHVHLNFATGAAPDWLRTLATKCMSYDMDERPSFSSIQDEFTANSKFAS